MRVAFDIETNGLQLDVDKIHCIVVIDIDSDRRWILRTEEQFDNFYNSVFTNVTLWIGHNVIDYDCLVLEKVLGWKFDYSKVYDTLTASKLAFPDIKDSDIWRVKAGTLPNNLIGAYSLEAFGLRLGEHKQHFQSDWSVLTDEMVEYCEQDVIVTKTLYKKIQEKEVSKEALDLEHSVRKIISRQTFNGWSFNHKEADKLYKSLLIKKITIEEEVKQFFPDFVDEEVFIPKVNNKARGYEAGVPFVKKKMTTFNCASRQHIARGLQEQYGWKPEEYTETGIPKINEGVLASLKYEGAQKLGDYFVIQKILGMVGEGKNAWLKMSRKERIHGAVDTIGAVTGRMTHRKPNMSQVPACYSPYGKECRTLFKATNNNKLVGCDASGLELRCLAHYMGKYDDGQYADVVVHGDVHTTNMEALGITDRNIAKTWIYAFLYGAGAEKLGVILGCSSYKATTMKESFLEKLPALKELQTKVREASTRGFLYGLDKRKIPIRSAHSALNTLLQSAGAIVMKQALHNLAPYVYENNAEFVGNIHDEWQIDVPANNADTVGQHAVQAIRQAGKDFNFLCPLDGEYKVGDNWAETH